MDVRSKQSVIRVPARDQNMPCRAEKEASSSCIRSTMRFLCQGFGSEV